MSANPHDRSIEDLVGQFCSIILTEQDYLNIAVAEEYIISLNASEQAWLSSADFNSHSVICVVKDSLNLYIQRYQNVTNQGRKSPSPFAFDIEDNYSIFQKRFKDIYEQIHNPAICPKVFSDIFAYIDGMSEHYRVFEQFYIIRSEQTLQLLFGKVREDALSVVTDNVNEIIGDSVQKFITEATTNASVRLQAKTDIVIKNVNDSLEAVKNNAATVVENVDNTAKVAIEKVEKTVRSETDKAVKEKMVLVSTKITETSVAILGVFSGIVLAVVAGLFYSSSVLENMLDVSLFRLICISALVGFICFNLIAVLLLFIERFRTSVPLSEGNGAGSKNDEDSTNTNDDVLLDSNGKMKKIHSMGRGLFSFLFKGITKFVNITLLVIMVITFMLEFFLPMPHDSDKADGSNINISGDVNVSMSDTSDTMSDTSDTMSDTSDTMSDTSDTMSDITQEEESTDKSSGTELAPPGID